MKIIEKAREQSKLLIILDVEDLEVTTHAMIPTGNRIDIEEYERNLKSKVNKEDNHLKECLEYPYLNHHCVLWAQKTFENFFEKIFFELSEFTHHPGNYLKKLAENQEDTYGWKNYILELIKEIFVNQTLHNFADCVDVAIDLFQVSQKFPYK
jgi:hypothetical protein